MVRSNIHLIGITSIYMASKFYELYPNHVNCVSSQIGHGMITPQEIIAEEKKYLKLFGFNINFVTHHDFLETYE